MSPPAAAGIAPPIIDCTACWRATAAWRLRSMSARSRKPSRVVWIAVPSLPCNASPASLNAAKPSILLWLLDKFSNGSCGIGLLKSELSAAGTFALGFIVAANGAPTGILGSPMGAANGLPVSTVSSGSFAVGKPLGNKLVCCSTGTSGGNIAVLLGRIGSPVSGSIIILNPST